MKKLILSLLLVLVSARAEAAVNVFACEPEWAALAKEIGGANVEVTSATTGGQDPHHIRAKPSLLAAMRRADLVFCTGAGLEAGWLPVLQQQAMGPKTKTLLASNSVFLMDKPVKVDRAMGDVHPEGNPHIQTDPHNILSVAKALTETLSSMDAAQAGVYKANLNDFSTRWNASMKKWEAAGAKLRGTPVIVYHDSWNYLNRWLGLKEVTTLEVKPGVPPTPSHLQDVLSSSKAAGVKLIMLTPFDDAEAAEWLSSQTGAKVVKLPFTVQSGETLEATFDRTLEALQ